MNEMEDYLKRELTLQDEQLKVVAMKLEELASIDCPLGVCVYDPNMYRIEHALDEIQHHRNVIEDTLNTVRHQAI